MKSIILTQAPINDCEKNLLINTDIFKLALNQHADTLCPDVRFIADYTLANICKNFSQKVVSVRDKFRYQTNRVEYFDTEFKGSTIIAAVEYLISKNFSEVLIVADNTVHSSEFQNWTKSEMDKLKSKLNIYQYSNGNFNLPIKSISTFCEK